MKDSQYYFILAFLGLVLANTSHGLWIGFYTGMTAVMMLNSFIHSWMEIKVSR